MALDRDQVGLIFKIEADSADARRDFELLQGVVEGVALELRDSLGSAAQRTQTQFNQLGQTVSRFNNQLAESSTGALRGFVGQFGIIGDAAAGMIPSVTGASAAVLGVAGAAVGAAVGMQQLISTATEFTGRIDDLSQVTGLANETIQSLQLASVLAGQSFESVSQTAVIFQRRLQEAREGNEQLRETFDALQIDLDGDVDAAFRQTLERLNGMTDGAQKTAVAIDLFGRSGAALLPVITQVGGEFENLVNRSKELGIVLSEDDLQASNAFQDSIDILTLKAKGLAYTIGVELVKALGLLGDAFAEAFPAEATATNEPSLVPYAPVDRALIARLEGVDTGAIDLDRRFAEIERRRREAALKQTATRAGRSVTGPTAEELNERTIRELQALERLEQGEQDALLRREKNNRDYDQAIEDGFQRRAQARVQELIDEENQAREEEDLRLRSLRQIQAYNQQIIDGNRRRLEAEMDAYVEYLERLEEIRQERLRNDPSSPFSIFGPEAQSAADRGAGLFGQMAISANTALAEVSDNLGSFQTIAVDAFSSVVNGLTQIISTFLLTGQISGRVFKEMARQVIASVASQAAVKAVFELAEGFAALALSWVMPSMAGKAAGHFKAAAIYGSVAGIAIAAGAALGGSAGPGDTQFVSGNGNRGQRVIEQGRQEPVVVVVRAETEPGVIVRQVVSDYRANGETRQMLRRDLLAEAY